ncbi:hypothetical protein AB0O20_02765 [Streptomyces kronopolitis]|uniref:hypothetical protein n=1 Tax=Streptomyces kronopolitis TaxID=1612435 RepID=UPI0034248130
MAELGHEVLGMDCDMDKVAILNFGKSPFHERDLDDMLARHAASGRLKFTPTRRPPASPICTSSGLAPRRRPGEHAYDLDHLFGTPTKVS